MIELLFDVTSELLNSEIGKDAKEYLRNRIPDSIIKEYRFGYMPNDDNIELLTDIFSVKYLERHNIVYRKSVSGGSKLVNYFSNHNLIFPFYDVFGNFSSIVGRSLLPDSEQKEIKISKYKYTIGHNKGIGVFGLDRARDSILDNDFVICVEGQFDYFSLISSGIINCVALGWSNMTDAQFFWLRAYTKNIYLLFDNDDAGKSGMMKIKKNFGESANIKTISLIPGYKDIDEYLRSDDLNKEKVINSLKSGFRR